MEKENGVSTSAVASVLLAFVITFFKGVQGTIGVNYGTVANDLPLVEEVAHFLLQKTVINCVRLFDANPSMLRAFAHTGIEVTITVPNEQIPDLANLSFAQAVDQYSIMCFLTLQQQILFAS
ncbi:hypothetical protein IFM89_009065 [Coptis chinensis]|uniref:Glucan endo-1,3-beta-D-glucosidase n=1 Tax=Coptis chinensis TaxID=261450 RepID=A0A835IQC0_9MAGN|nr:hypothetical protein IFM89_009065 [Coptis chinensis]